MHKRKKNIINTYQDETAGLLQLEMQALQKKLHTLEKELEQYKKFITITNGQIKINAPLEISLDNVAFKITESGNLEVTSQNISLNGTHFLKLRAESIHLN